MGKVGWRPVTVGDAGARDQDRKGRSEKWQRKVLECGKLAEMTGKARFFRID